MLFSSFPLLIVNNKSQKKFSNSSLNWSTDREIFSFRGGYFFENIDKGGRRFLTLGLGIKYNNLGVDFSYLSTTQNDHPLAETMRFSVAFLFDRVEENEENQFLSISKASLLTPIIKFSLIECFTRKVYSESLFKTRLSIIKLSKTKSL